MNTETGKALTLAEAFAVADTVSPTPAVAHEALQMLVAELRRVGCVPEVGGLARIGRLLSEVERAMREPECLACNGHLREVSYSVSGFKQRFADYWPSRSGC